MRYLLLFLCLALPSAAEARPVTWPGGWMVMTMNDASMHSVHATYSPTAHYSVGYLGEYWSGEDWQFHSVQLNNLLHRWNLPSSQGNLYLENAAGIAYSDFGAFDGKVEPAAMTGISADWETRRVFTSYLFHLYDAGDIERFFMQKARVGVAPYVGEYGDLHTWLMLEVDHNPKREGSEVLLTPLVRMFKGNYLGEFGISTQGDVLLNLTAQF